MAVFAASAAAVIALMVTTGMIFIPLFTLACIGGGHVKSWRGRHSARTGRGQALLGLLLAVCVVYLVVDLTAALFGGALPQAKFALLAMAVTSFDLKSQRNLYSHTWHSLAILYVAALFAWDWLFVVFVLGWAAAVGGFVAATRGGVVNREPRGARSLARRLAPWGWPGSGVGAVAFVTLPALPDARYPCRC